MNMCWVIGQVYNIGQSVGYSNTVGFGKKKTIVNIYTAILFLAPLVQMIKMIFESLKDIVLERNLSERQVIRWTY